MSSDVFCEIVARNDPDEIVHADATTVAFLDVAPLQFGHLLVVPRQHVVTLDELPADQLAPFFGFVQRAVVAVQEVLGAEGAFVANNNVVSQSVPHLHVHVVPRRRGDGLRGFFWPRHRYGGDEPVAHYRALLRSALAD